MRNRRCFGNGAKGSLYRKKESETFDLGEGVAASRGSRESSLWGTPGQRESVRSAN